jgi:hypothetical protein
MNIILHGRDKKKEIQIAEYIDEGMPWYAFNHSTY